MAVVAGRSCTCGCFPIVRGFRLYSMNPSASRARRRACPWSALMYTIALIRTRARAKAILEHRRHPAESMLETPGWSTKRASQVTAARERFVLLADVHRRRRRRRRVGNPTAARRKRAIQEEEDGEYYDEGGTTRTRISESARRESRFFWA